MTSIRTAPSADRPTAAFDVGFNEALDDAHDRAVAAAPEEPEDVYIFHDPRVRRMLAYAVLAVVALAMVVGIALFVEWLQVGRHQVSAVAPLAAQSTEVEPSSASIGGGFLRLGVGFLIAVAIAGFAANAIVRPGRA